MHILSDRNRNEFLAVPSLCRVAMALGSDCKEPTLLVKANTLVLKSLVQGASIRLLLRLNEEDGCLTYGVEIDDDPKSPALIWSYVEDSGELEALQRIYKGELTPIFLFNEIALNVSEVLPIKFDLKVANGEVVFEKVKLQPKMTPERQSDISEQFPDNFLERDKFWDVILTPKFSTGWREIRNTYITNAADHSDVNILNTDEGSQQEQLALWLSDCLDLAGVAINPEVGLGRGRREFCDLFFGHEFGSFLIESKSISVLGRSDQLTQSKIQKNTIKQIDKAVRQLAGACKVLRLGADIYFGEKLLGGFDRTNPPHCIVLVSDLHALGSDSQIKIDVVMNFSVRHGGMLHFLDITELQRLIQGAHFQRENGSLSLMAYFDYFLIKRWEKTLESREPIINMLIHGEKD